MSKRNVITIDFIKKYLKDYSNTILISKKYINANEKLELLCECGNTYFMSWDKLKQSKHKSCRRCANKKSRNENRIKSYEKAKKLAEDNMCELILSQEDYESTKQIVKYKCRCGDVFEKSMDSFRMSKYKMCKKCTLEKMLKQKEENGSKISLNEMYKYIEDNSKCKIKHIHGVSLLSRVDFICECGNEFWMTFNGFKNSRHKKCRRCVIDNWPKEGIYNSYDYEFVKREVEKHGLKLLQDYYNNSIEKLKLKCTCGEIFYIPFTRFHNSNQKHCKKCGYKNGANKQTMSFEEFKNRVNGVLGYDYEILDFKKASGFVKMKHIKCGHIYTQKGGKILSGQRCPKCYAPIKKTFEEAYDEVNGICGDNLKLLEYINHDNLILQCKCGNKLKRGMSDIRKHKGAFCDKCNASAGSMRIEKFLNENNIDYIKEYSFEDCLYKRKLRFDFYLPKLNTCIEYDGEQHYRVLHHWGGENGLNLNQIRDNIKNEYCKNNNIDLIRISFKDDDYIEKILSSKIS